jgi:hypothetical protein
VNKKEAKKTLLPWDVTAPVSQPREAERKSFWFFFFRKRTSFANPFA